MIGSIEDLSEQLAAAIRTAVREHRLEIDGAKKVYPLDDMTIDYVDETTQGQKIYQVYGQTLAVFETEFNDTGDFYFSPIKEDETVDVSVSLRVLVNEETDKISVETEEIIMGG